MRHIHVLTTGGTIEKVYDETAGDLKNVGTNVARMVGRLKLPDAQVHFREIFSKDSLLITDEERRRIVDVVRETLRASPPPNGIIIIHGTDTLCITGDLLHAELFARAAAAPSGAGVVRPAAPIILTGAWRPFEMKRSDAMQNLTEALFATSTLPPGAYVVAHGRALMFPGVVKDREIGTFTKQ